MDVCQAVETESDKIINKFDNLNRSNNKIIDETLKFLENIKGDLISQSTAAAVVAEDDGISSGFSMDARTMIQLQQAARQSKEAAAKISSSHRELHAAVSRLGKVIDKHFVQDFNVMKCPEALQGKDKQEALNKSIIEYLCRQGLLEVGTKLAEEAGILLDESRVRPFMELNGILQSLSARDVGPALAWVAEHHDQLEARHSPLEYKLHRLQFLEILRTQPEQTVKILQYARNFQKFQSPAQIADLQKLMGSLLFLSMGLDKSPYRDLMQQDHWLDVKETFTKEACALLGLSLDSPLTVCIKMGCRAIPMLLNIRAAMMNHQVGEIWNCSKQELPIEVEVSPEYLYHSRFSCPILRQQSTEKNPPMRLNCGHVISRDALQRLATSTKSTKIKCPYCPSEQTPSEAKQICL